MVDRYGPDIEADLHQIGLDLLDFFRGRYSWRKLDVLLQRTPRTSFFTAAIANDPEHAERVLALEKERKRRGIPEPAPRPSLTEYTAEVARLDLVVDWLQAVHLKLEHLRSGRPPGRHVPQRRPETALDRAKALRRWAQHDALVDEVEQARARRAAAG